MNDVVQLLLGPLFLWVVIGLTIAGVVISLYIWNGIKDINNYIHELEICNSNKERDK